MKQFEVEISPAAAKDLEDIWFYIAQRNPVAADRVLHTLTQRIFSLTTMPERAQLRADIGPTARCLIEGSYLVLYEAIGSKVEVVRVVHGAVNLDKILG